MGDTQTYASKSAFSDPQNIASAISVLLACLALPEVVAVIPVTWMPAIAAIGGVLSIVLRVFTGVRPVSAIAPGQVKPVEVKSLDYTQPKT